MHLLLFIYFLISSLVFAVLSTGRGPIVLVILSLCLIYLLESPRKALGFRALIVLTILGNFTWIIFWSLGSLTGKTDDNIEGALQTLLDYSLSSIPALSVWLDAANLPLIGNMSGEHIFRIFRAIGARLDLVEYPPSLVQEDVAVPHLTNLFTIYLQYLQEFGLLLFWLPLVPIAFLNVYLYQRYLRARTELSIYFLCLSYFPLLQSVFQELYFSNIATWFQLSLLLFFFIRRENRFSYI